MVKKQKIEEKIFCTQNDTLEALLERIQGISATTLFITMPRDAVCGATDAAFQKIKEISATSQKKITIESVDDNILSRAKRAGFIAYNPIFGAPKKTVADIVSRVPISKSQKEKISPDIPIENVPETKQQEKSFTKRIRTVLLWGGIIGVCGVGIWIMLFVMPRATITLTLTKTEVPFEENVLVDIKAYEVNATTTPIVIPGELSRTARNLEKTFQGGGEEYVATKAHGTLTVFNVFSATPQKIVAGTRFESPEGKIFRITEAFTIPGAKVVNGKITSSSIDVAVVADQIGESYNVPVSVGWRIPGFKGSPKYEGFFANASRKMEGGFEGNRVKVSEQDIASSTGILANILRESLENQMTVLRTSRFKLLEGATRFTLLHTDIQYTAATGTFSIFGEGEAKEILFEESALRDAVLARILRTRDASMRVHEMTLLYSAPNVDFEKGAMSFVVTGTTTLIQNIEKDNFRSQILGANEEKRKIVITSIPGIQSAVVKLWPFWVSVVPRDPAKIGITIQ